MRTFIHEAGHALAAVSLGARISAIIVDGERGYTRFRDTYGVDPDCDFVGAAGPLAEHIITGTELGSCGWAADMGQEFDWDQVDDATHFVENNFAEILELAENLARAKADNQPWFAHITADWVDTRGVSQDDNELVTWASRVVWK